MWFFILSSSLYSAAALFFPRYIPANPVGFFASVIGWFLIRSGQRLNYYVLVLTAALGVAYPHLDPGWMRLAERNLTDLSVVFLVPAILLCTLFSKDVRGLVTVHPFPR